MECRICFDSANSEDMISPCLCRGSSKYVHRECLNDWFELSENPHARSNCQECQFNYYKTVPVKIPMNNFIVFVANYRFITFIVYQLLILLLYYILEQFYHFEFILDNSFFYINNYFISGCIWLFFGLIFNMILICQVKERGKYFKFYDNESISVVLCLSLVLGLSFYFIPIFSIVFASGLIIQLVKNHHDAIKEMISNSSEIVSFTDEEIEKLREEIV